MLFSTKLTDISQANPPELTQQRAWKKGHSSRVFATQKKFNENEAFECASVNSVRSAFGEKLEGAASARHKSWSRVIQRRCTIRGHACRDTRRLGLIGDCLPVKMIVN